MILWNAELKDAYVTVWEDNECAKAGIVRGMSMHWDFNILLALVWGFAARRRTHLWADRVASKDNPADCLTKRHLDRSHLRHGRDVTGVIDWAVVFTDLERILNTQSLPAWQSIDAFLALPLAVSFQ